MKGKDPFELPTASSQLRLYDVLGMGMKTTERKEEIWTYQIGDVLVPFKFCSDPQNRFFSGCEVGDDWR